jgi:hypothetical protein
MLGGQMGKILGALREASRVLLGRKPAGRRLTVYADDLFIVSYPRSGNTWTRFLIGNLLYENEPVTFLNIEKYIPAIYLWPDRVMRRLPRPRVLKSHECFDPRYKRVIYIVRDPRDVAVSYYHYAIKRNVIPDGYPITEFIHRFMDGEFDLAWNWAASWGDHVLSWMSLRQGRQNFLLLRYEDMLQDTENELRKVAHLVGIEPTPERLRRAMELSSATRMRDLEKTQGKDWKLTKDTRQDKPFVRSAHAGDWRTALPASSVAEIEQAWGSIMKQVGYDLSTELPVSQSVGSATMKV